MKIHYSTLVRRLVRALGLNRRYGVRFDNGSTEHGGFRRRYQAEAFGQDSMVPFIVYNYEPAIDMRINGSKGDGRATCQPVSPNHIAGGYSY